MHALQESNVYENVIWSQNNEIHTLKKETNQRAINYETLRHFWYDTKEKNFYFQITVVYITNN